MSKKCCGSKSESKEKNCWSESSENRELTSEEMECVSGGGAIYNGRPNNQVGPAASTVTDETVWGGPISLHPDNKKPRAFAVEEEPDDPAKIICLVVGGANGAENKNGMVATSKDKKM